MPTVPALGYSVVLHNKKLVVFGGRSEAGELCNEVWEVDQERLVAVAVEAKGKIPEARVFHTAHVHNDSMYIIHGHVQKVSQSFRYKLPVYDLARCEWDCLPTTGDAPGPLCHHASCLLAPVIIVSGGCVYPTSQVGEDSDSDSEAASSIPAFYELSLDSHIWTRIEVPTSPSCWGHSAVLWHDAMYVFGGHDLEADRDSRVMWKWNFVTRKWIKSTACEGKVVNAYLPSEAERKHKLPLEVGQSLVVLDEAGDGWSKGKSSDGRVGWFPTDYVTLSSPSPRSLHTSVATDTGVLVVGGETGEPLVKLNDCWLFEPATAEWRQLKPHSGSHPGLAGHAAVWDNGQMVLLMLSRNQLFFFNPRTSVWSHRVLYRQNTPNHENAHPQGANGSPSPVPTVNAPPGGASNAASVSSPQSQEPPSPPMWSSPMRVQPNEAHTPPPPPPVHAPPSLPPSPPLPADPRSSVPPSSRAATPLQGTPAAYPVQRPLPPSIAASTPRLQPLGSGKGLLTPPMPAAVPPTGPMVSLPPGIMVCPQGSQSPARSRLGGSVRQGGRQTTTAHSPKYEDQYRCAHPRDLGGRGPPHHHHHHHTLPHQQDTPSSSPAAAVSRSLAMTRLRSVHRRTSLSPPPPLKASAPRYARF